jgi:hypothetical protein
MNGGCLAFSPILHNWFGRLKKRARTLGTRELKIPAVFNSAVAQFSSTK